MKSNELRKRPHCGSVTTARTTQLLLGVEEEKEV